MSKGTKTTSTIACDVNNFVTSTRSLKGGAVQDSTTYSAAPDSVTMVSQHTSQPPQSVSFDLRSGHAFFEGPVLASCTGTTHNSNGDAGCSMAQQQVRAGQISLQNARPSFEALCSTAFYSALCAWLRAQTVSKRPAPTSPRRRPQPTLNGACVGCQYDPNGYTHAKIGYSDDGNKDARCVSRNRDNAPHRLKAALQHHLLWILALQALPARLWTCAPSCSHPSPLRTVCVAESARLAQTPATAHFE